MTCQVCGKEMTTQDAAAYRNRCESCWSGGLVDTPNGLQYHHTQPACGCIPFEDRARMGVGLARNGQVVRSGKSHGCGM